MATPRGDGGTMDSRQSAGKLAAAADRYGRFWAELRSDNTRELLGLARPDMCFRDPFNTILGAGRVTAMLDHMFAHSTDVRFDILRHAWADDTAFYRWDFGCRLRRPAIELHIAGMSEVRFDGDGLVAAHTDHWDAASQVYARIPGLGGLLGLIGRRLAFRG